jgi:hypothetical protein
MAFQVTGTGLVCAPFASVEKVHELWKAAWHYWMLWGYIAKNQSSMRDIVERLKLISSRQPGGKL